MLSFLKSMPKNLGMTSSFIRSFSEKVRTEKEKMLAGEFYLSEDPQLVKERTHTRMIVDEYNKTTAQEQEKRKKLLNELLGKETNAYVETPFHCDYGTNIKMGKGCYFNFNCTILDVCEVEIGDGCLFAPNVSLYGATHPTDPTLRKKLLEYGQPIKIGNNVWLGGSVTVCPGVTIGDNSVIGAGSVVSKDIPANVVAVGNPARVVKHLTPPKDE